MKVWTLVITGGSPFEVKVEGGANPPIVHDGGKTMAKVVLLDAAQAHALSDLLSETGATVKMFTEDRPEEEGEG